MILVCKSDFDKNNKRNLINNLRNRTYLESADDV